MVSFSTIENSVMLSRHDGPQYAELLDQPWTRSRLLDRADRMLEGSSQDS